MGAWSRHEERGGDRERTAGHLRRLLLASVCALACRTALAAEALPLGAASCSGCHAASPVGEADAPTDLATLAPDAIVAALAAYRSGARPGTIMPRLAKGFSDAESRAIASALGRHER